MSEFGEQDEATREALEMAAAMWDELRLRGFDVVRREEVARCGR